MNRLKGLVGVGSISSVDLSSKSSTTSLSAAQEMDQLQHAMLAAMHIMNDDMESAQKSLAEGSSSFHFLGRGIVTFLRAIIGSEQDIMKEASQRLSEAETVSSENRKRSERDPSAYRSEVYPPGTEHALCTAEAQIMSAGVAVLNENVIEALKGFYKMRKAYLTLDSIAGVERDYINAHRHKVESKTSSINASQSQSSLNVGKLCLDDQNGDGLVNQGDVDDDDDNFHDAEDSLLEEPTQEYLGRLEKDGQLWDRSSIETTRKAHANLWAETSVEDEAAVKALFTNRIDVFVQSGTSLHYGIILLMLSLVPPTFARLLAIVGFRGDRKRGLDLLWRASTAQENINGCVAALILTGFYNSVINFLDILPPGAYPKPRIDKLVREMRGIYPNSRFWYLQEARSYAAEKDLERAVSMLEKVEKEDCKLRQVEALQWFEKSIDLMFLHDYTGCSAAFQRCVKLNNWSHGLYFYMAACCHIELYRVHSAAAHAPLPPVFGVHLKRITPDETLAAEHAARAETLLTENVAPRMGKKKLMGRQLPFDAFVLRKLAKWKSRAAALGCSLVDAVGVSPLEEMIYFWGGLGRMRPAHLHDSLVRLAFCDGGAAELFLPTLADAAADKVKVEVPAMTGAALAACADADECATLALLRAAIYRCLRRPDLTRAAVAAAGLQSLTASSFKHAPHAESWPVPVSRYELAVVAWIEGGGSTGADAAAENKADLESARKAKEGKYDVQKLVEASVLLEEAAGWEAFDLDTRFGIKISTGRETLKALGVAGGKQVQ